MCCKIQTASFRGVGLGDLAGLTFWWGQLRGFGSVVAESSEHLNDKSATFLVIFLQKRYSNWHLQRKFRVKKIPFIFGCLHRAAQITLILIYKVCLPTSHWSIRYKFDSLASVKPSRQDVQTASWSIFCLDFFSFILFVLSCPLYVLTFISICLAHKISYCKLPFRQSYIYQNLHFCMGSNLWKDEWKYQY